MQAPLGHHVHKLITGVGGIDIKYGAPMVECTLVTPKGTVKFSSPHPRGLIFPGYEEEQIVDEDTSFVELPTDDQSEVGNER